MDGIPPPYIHHGSRPLSAEEAANMMDRYINLSLEHPQLHPDALITPTGVAFPAHGGPAGGVVMHHLRRVARGLRGEWVSGSVLGDDGEGGEHEGATDDELEEEDYDEEQVEAGAVYDEMEVDQSEAAQESQHMRTAAETEGGETAQRVPASPSAPSPAKSKKGKQREERGKYEDVGDNKLDKEARKQAKKERAKKYRREKEKERAE